MKELVISVVSFFVWLGMIFSVMVGYFIGNSAGHQILGAIAGFMIGCFASGFWFLLVSMHEKLAIIAGAAKKVHGAPTQEPGDNVKNSDERTPGWLDVISGGKP